MTRYPKPSEPIPDDDELIDMLSDGECYATDGCIIEPDGTCPHGYPSWILWLGMI